MMTVREIKTKTIQVDGKDVIVPELDENGKEIEISCVEVPLHIEAAEGTAEERKAAIDGFVTDARAATAPPPNEAA